MRGNEQYHLPLHEWSKLSDEALKENLVKYAMYDNYAPLKLISQYPKQIVNSGIRGRVDKIILDSIGQISDGVGARALRICLDLNLNGTKEKILSVLPKIESLYDEMRIATRLKPFEIEFYLTIFNEAVIQLDLRETLSFIEKQLEPLLLKGPIPPPPTKEYSLFFLACTALGSLYKIAPELAEKYKRSDVSIPLPPSVWSNLREEDLQEELVKYIMNGNYAHLDLIEKYPKHIVNSSIKDRVDKIILDLVIGTDASIGERAIEICSSLNLNGAKEKVLMALPKVESLYEEMRTITGLEPFGNLQYLLQFNHAVAKLNLIEAVNFIEKQAGPIKGPVVQLLPLTPEYYLLFIATTALKVLYKIAPELAEKYNEPILLQRNLNKYSWL